MKHGTIIAALIGACATITAALIGLNAGKNEGQRNIQNQINEAFGDVVNVIGDSNNVTVNDIKEFIDDYQNLQTQNESLTAQNMKYFDDLKEANKQLEELNTQIEDTPILTFNNFGLSIDGEDIAINKNNSMVTIDGRDYVSKEIMEKLIPENQNITIKNDTLFIGKVIANKANLIDQWIVDSYLYTNESNIVDSYGNNHTNVIYFNKNRTYSADAYAVFNVNRKYNYLSFKVAVSRTSDNNAYGIIVIKSGSDVIYTSDEINLTTEPFEIKDILITDCSLLTINYNYKGNAECILYDAIIYN